jgi:hypothetical protein
MPPPLADVRIDWRADGFSSLANDGFETNTTGWSVAAGIQAAATSITRTVSGAYMGTAVGRLVTTSTNGSGVKNIIGGTFTSGRTYRFRVALKSVSGTTAAKILIGSLGTPGDRASTTMTLTTGWLLYQVDWTPSSNRTDVQVNVTNNAASIMTADIDDAEVFEALDDISDRCPFLTVIRGANFDGSQESPGSLTLRLRNDDGRFSPDNGSSPLSGLIKLGRRVWLRATHLAVPYGLFYGEIRRIIPRPGERMVELLCEDPLYRMSVRRVLGYEEWYANSFRDIRNDLAIALGSAANDLAGGIEDEIPANIELDSVLAVLTEINRATGTIHYVRADPSPSILSVYTTRDRATLQSAASVETWNDDLNGLANYDVTDELLVNSQDVRVSGAELSESPETVWESPDVPFVFDTSITTNAAFDEGVAFQEASLTATGDAAVTSHIAGMRQASIHIEGTGAQTVTALSITGRPYRSTGMSVTSVSDSTSIATYGTYEGREISSELITSEPFATGLADWWVFRYKDGAARPTATFEDDNYVRMLTRQLTDVVTLDFGLLSISGRRFRIRGITLSALAESSSWRADFQLEEVPAALNLVRLDGTADQGLGGTAILGH